ncbi:MAG: NADH-quinone oxidoreductase subunit C [Gallionellaceae bacterium]|nr:NADH-quinone oxidoreductase subunit C [Gallionellaceae bacterium]
MPVTPEVLLSRLEGALGDKLVSGRVALGEVTIEVRPEDWHDVAMQLRDEPGLRFDQLIDLCGVDYSAYAETGRAEGRYAVVMHLLSVARNHRLRVRGFCADDEMPVIASVVGVWAVANWYEREAFDLVGIVFDGHPDLRRILTDYGFIGHPFRKDFPVHGQVEMRYDPEQRRVIYQPVSIDLREVTPRIVREENFGDVGHG